MASCVGSDQLGAEARRRLQTRNVDTSLIQSHPTLGTGMVIATLDEKGDATYEFDTPAAWDGLTMGEELEEAVEGAKVVVMGSLASRLGSSSGSTSAATIRSIRNAAKQDSVVMDINLRPPWYEAGDVLALCRGDRDSAEALALLKLNDDELPIVESWCGVQTARQYKEEDMLGGVIRERMEALASTVNANRICVTRGENGAALYCRDGDIFVENDGYAVSESESQPGSDTVGAGDSFLAALVKYLLLEDETPEVALDRACALGAYVANMRGAVPTHEDAPVALRRIFAP